MINHNREKPWIIFHSENGGVVGGSDFYMGRLIDAIDRERWQVGVLVRPDYPMERICKSSGTVSRIDHGASLTVEPKDASSSQTHSVRVVHPKQLLARRGMSGRAWSMLPRPWRRDFGLLREVRSARRKLSPYAGGIFHTMDGGCQPAAVGAARAQMRVIVSYCGPPRPAAYSPIQRKINRDTNSTCARSLVKSSFAREAWAAKNRIALDQIDIIPNGLDTALFDATDDKSVRDELGYSGTDVVLGFTGRLNQEKGADVWAKAIPVVAERAPRARFLFIGEGELEPSIRARLSESDLADRTSMLGFRSDVAALLSACDVLVVPSVAEEMFGWVVLEGMAARCAIIGSDVGGLPELIRHDSTGLLVPPGQPPALAEAAVKLCQDEPQRQRLGQAGRTLVESQYTAKDMLRRTFDLYERCLHGFPMRRQDLMNEGVTLPC